MRLCRLQQKTADGAIFNCMTPAALRLLLTAAVFALSLASCCAVTHVSVRQQGQPKPLLPGQAPRNFTVAAVDANGHLVLLRKDSAEWPREATPAAFTRSVRDTFQRLPATGAGGSSNAAMPLALDVQSPALRDQTRALNRALAQHVQAVTVTVAAGGQSAGTPQATVVFTNDDFADTSVYAITPDGVRPLAFGACGKLEGARAALHGLAALVVVAVAGLIGVRRTQAFRGRPEAPARDAEGKCP